LAATNAARYNCDHIGLNSVYDPFGLDRKRQFFLSQLQGAARTHPAGTGNSFKFSHFSAGCPHTQFIGTMPYFYQLICGRDVILITFRIVPQNKNKISLEMPLAKKFSVLGLCLYEKLCPWQTPIGAWMPKVIAIPGSRRWAIAFQNMGSFVLKGHGLTGCGKTPNGERKPR
jgi:hypothetical protein